MIEKAERAAGNKSPPTSAKGKVYEPVMSKSSPAISTLLKPPIWWNMNVIPEIVPRAFKPYTSAVVRK